MDNGEAIAKKSFSRACLRRLEMIMLIILMDQGRDNEMGLWLGKWKTLHWVLGASAINCPFVCLI